MEHVRLMRGFSILEISVVLVIVALLVGGVMGGQTLLEASKLRRVLDDSERYRRAVAQFQEKYNEMPGDMTYATEVWGSAGGTGSDAACILTDSTGRKSTCNGNGDGFIWTGIFCPLGTENWCFGERHRAWQHLVNAELVTGNFSGRHALTDSWHTMGDINAPKASFDGTMFSLSHMEETFLGDPNFFPTRRSEVLFFGTQVNGVAAGVSNPLLHASIFFKLDTKADDGLPGSGAITTLHSASVFQPGCVSTTAASTARYVVESPQKLCAWLYFSLKK